MCSARASGALSERLRAGDPELPQDPGAACPGARDPAGRARSLLVLAEADNNARAYDKARKEVDEALLLQPEGRWNAEGRLLSAQIELSQGNYDAAARAFMTVGVLYDDPSITPRALQQAAHAYRKSNNLMDAQKAETELKQRFPDFGKSPKVSRQEPAAAPSHE